MEQAAGEGVFPQKLINTDMVYRKVLGQGGQGTVCLYQDENTMDEFAVKFGSSPGDPSIL
jgi:hypothetical protein